MEKIRNKGILNLWINDKTNSVCIEFKQPFFTKLRICLGVLLERKLAFYGAIIYHKEDQEKKEVGSNEAGL